MLQIMFLLSTGINIENANNSKKDGENDYNCENMIFKCLKKLLLETVVINRSCIMK